MQDPSGRPFVADSSCNAVARAATVEDDGQPVITTFIDLEKDARSLIVSARILLGSDES